MAKKSWVTISTAIVFSFIMAILAGCNQNSTAKYIPVSPMQPSLTEELPTVDIIEFPTRAEFYQYATITIKASKSGAYDLTLVDENAGGLNSDRAYALGTILTDGDGVGSWHFKIDESFELDRVKIRYKEGQQTHLIIDMVVIFK
jgi:hypothetical protein